MGVSSRWLEGVGGTGYHTTEAEAHRQLACSAYASPAKLYWVRGVTVDGRCQSPDGQSEIWNLSLRKGGGGGGGTNISNLEEDLLASQCLVGEVACDLEQHRNDIVGCVGNNLHLHQREAAIKATQVAGCTRAMHGALAEIPATRPSPDPLRPVSYLLAPHQIPQVPTHSGACCATANSPRWAAHQHTHHGPASRACLQAMHHGSTFYKFCSVPTLALRWAAWLPGEVGLGRERISSTAPLPLIREWVEELRLYKDGGQG
jgi:hypothetical protein